MGLKLCLLIVGLMVAVQLPANKIYSPTKNRIEEDILYYVNLHRKSKGLRPLRLNSVESSVATRHSKDMATGKVPFGHQGFDDRAKTLRKKLGSITMVGENVASGQMTAKEAVDGWLHSPGHRRNIEGDFSMTGIGWAKDRRGMIYYTQIFTK
ncbi:MAG: CAP domain-containing protein [Bacteroidetes bacterium]|nr:MAG: CAP domain-containing protein [Bacteroidota bacterium]